MSILGEIYSGRNRFFLCDKNIEKSDAKYLEFLMQSRAFQSMDEVTKNQDIYDKKYLRLRQKYLYLFRRNEYFRQFSDGTRKDVLEEVKEGLQYLTKRAKFWEETTYN